MKHILNYWPFDSHVHFRRDKMMRAMAPHTARQCRSAVIMPNTATPHIFLPNDAQQYRDEIIAVTGEDFTPIMTGYLTNDSDPKLIEKGFADGVWHAMKVYPRAAKGAGTTHSDDGIVPWELINHPALPVMEDIGMPLLIHGEVNVTPRGEVIDIYDREKEYITILIAIRKKYPNLRISMEHGTSRELAEYMRANGNAETLVCTITPQHLMFDRRDLHENGFQPHLFCYPILKRVEARDAWRGVACSGVDWASGGTDSASHPTHAKEKACGCAGGVVTSHAMAPMYTQVFYDMDAMEHLENFLCVNGPRFYGLVPTPGKMTLEHTEWTMDSMIEIEDGTQVRPFGYHENPEERYRFPWKIHSSR